MFESQLTFHINTFKITHTKYNKKTQLNFKTVSNNSKTNHLRWNHRNFINSLCPLNVQLANVNSSITQFIHFNWICSNAYNFIKLIAKDHKKKQKMFEELNWRKSQSRRSSAMRPKPKQNSRLVQTTHISQSIVSITFHQVSR